MSEPLGLHIKIYESLKRMSIHTEQIAKLDEVLEKKEVE